ncbi:DUF202 domain-containing protein, partial [Candidatus Sumerlaeota bacterium]|nr:DUF202 domain-containing protein [Candidatus Sumerlaeota bacterium]
MTHESPQSPANGIGLNRLEVERTMLANERTLLAYLRTMLTFVVVGATLIKFFDSIPYTILGWGFNVAGAWLLWIGYRRYRQVKKQIEHYSEGGPL